MFYPYTKRFTWTANLLLGWALAISPSAAWIGVNGSLSLEPMLLSLAVALWAGSFDILYHTQDFEFQRENGLHSVAARFGVVKAFRIARTLDVLAVAALVALWAWINVTNSMELGWPFLAGVRRGFLHTVVQVQARLSVRPFQDGGGFRAHQRLCVDLRCWSARYWRFCYDRRGYRQQAGGRRDNGRERLDSRAAYDRRAAEGRGPGGGVGVFGGGGWCGSRRWMSRSGRLWNAGRTRGCSGITRRRNWRLR